jgi:cytochrome b561
MADEARAYGATSRWLHWLTLTALVTQFTIGYVIDADDHSGRGRGRAAGDSSGHGSGHHGRGGDDSVLGSGWNLVTTHVSLGLMLLLLATVRVVWRRASGLPPWAEALSDGDRRVVVVTERALLALLFVIPLTGLALVLGDDDWLPLHVTAHVAFFVAISAHVGMVLRRGLLPRMI